MNAASMSNSPPLRRPGGQPHFEIVLEPVLWIAPQCGA
jgi:hypothetical protein